MALVSKILESTLTAGSTTVTFTDSDIPNSLIRVFSSNSDIIPESRILSGNTLTVTYAPQSNNIDVAVEIVKQGLDIVDNVLSEDTDKALSAKQGYLLSAAIGDVSDGLSTLAETVDNLDIPDNINDLDDVNISSLQDGQILVSSNGVFVNSNLTLPTNDYSYTETEIGKWVDNSTIKRRVYDLGSDVSIANNAWTATGITISGLKYITNAFGISSGGTYYPLMAYHTSGAINALACRANASATIQYFIVEYNLN